MNAPAPTALQSQLVAAEYFFDADPGIGNGLAVTPGFAQADTVDETTIIPQSFAMLSQHTVSIRVKNTVGRWSLQETRSFFICDTIGPAGAIAGVDSVAACVNQNVIHNN